MRVNPTGLLLSRELGDQTAYARLSAAAEREYELRFFGHDDEMFGWWSRLNEGYPRGQQSARMMVSEVGSGGDWAGAFDVPHMNKFEAPTVEDIDYPALGVYQAWNDPASGTLHVGTYPTTPDRRGEETSWRVTGLPNAADVVVLCDGEPFDRFEVEGQSAIRLDTTMDTRAYQIFTGYRGTGAPRNAARPERPRERAAAGAAVAQRGLNSDGDADAIRSASRDVLSGGGPTCPCCS